MIRVGSDYYLTGTTMHAMTGLPILHSRDLVNWTFISYAFDRLNLGPQFRLEDGKQIYGQGIWAPSFRYHAGTFYIFANVNRFGLQVFRSSDPRCPWKHNRIEQGLHDLSVLFDDDGKIYAVYGARTIRIVELNHDLTALVPGTDRVLIEPALGMGEGSHFYKIHGKYYIVSAIPGAHVPMKCARAGKLAGPWEVTTISQEESLGESLGFGQGYRLKDGRRQNPPFELNPPDPSERRSLDLHQGGIVETPSGEWWGFFHAGAQLRRPADLFIPGHVGGWLALFRSARKPQALALDLGKTQYRSGFAHRFSLSAQRRLFGSEADSGVAVESSAGRFQMVALRAPGLSPFALPPRRRFLVGSKLADAARDRAGIDGHHGVGWQRSHDRRRCRIGASELALRVDRRAAR